MARSWIEEHVIKIFLFQMSLDFSYLQQKVLISWHIHV